MHPILVSALLFISIPACFPQTIPTTHGTSLSGKDIVLPQDIRANYTILILGFSQKSSEPSRDWVKQIVPAFAEDRNVAWYQMPVLASVPRMVRGIIVRAIKREVPDTIQPNFVPIYENEDQWKQAAGYREPDDAYVLVAHGSTVVWKTHGAATPERVRALKEAVAKPGVASEPGALHRVNAGPG
jgi:hypothetical protein